MNGTCAGGTGAFIDQMAALLETDAMGLNELAKGANQIYPLHHDVEFLPKLIFSHLLTKARVAKTLQHPFFKPLFRKQFRGLHVENQFAEMLLFWADRFIFWINCVSGLLIH